MTKEQENRFLILYALQKLKGHASKNEVLNFLLENNLIKLSTRDFELLKTRKEERWRNELAFVRSHLVKKGYLMNNERNQWEMTKSGLVYFDRLNNLISEETSRINLTQLKEFNLNAKNIINEEREIYKIRNIEKLSETEKENIILSRIGQGIFREELIDLYQKCCLTGFAFSKILIASHIKPWRFANNKERLDRYNGLLLQPNFDKVFDLGYITFKDSGEIIISNQIKNFAKLGLSNHMRVKLYDSSKIYMEYHRKNIFIK